MEYLFALFTIVMATWTTACEKPIHRTVVMRELTLEQQQGKRERERCDSENLTSVQLSLIHLSNLFFFWWVTLGMNSLVV